MQLRFTEYDEFLALNKPYGLRTHKVADGQYGFVEFLNEKLGQTLLVVHRLDKGTSGTILFAKSKETATQLSDLFEKHQVKKTYLFLTDKKSQSDQFKITSHIDKQNNSFFNFNDKEPNSETEFKFIKNIGPYYLWEASPKTGKPHQIRLHAEKARIPILGDDEHGGTKYFRLALHAKKIEFSLNGKDYSIETEATPIFSEHYENATLALLNESYFKRHNLYIIENNNSYRLMHLEAADLRADVLGNRLWVYDYHKHGLIEADKTALSIFCEQKNLVLIIRQMLDRGRGVGGLENTTLQVSTKENEWIAKEENLLFQLKINSGFSSGIFLDQRENRKWVQQNIAGKKTLNLFSYTSVFSVAAALGGASEVTSVDVSAKFLDWGKENFRLNLLDPDKYEFFVQDAIVFLKGAIKLQRQWDFIICDPPSFGRSKNSIWKLESDLPHLAKLMFDCLAPKGHILFTCNLEDRTRSEILDLFLKNLKKNNFEISRLPMMALDYELTDDLNNVMKGFVVRKLETISK